MNTKHYIYIVLITLLFWCCGGSEGVVKNSEKSNESFVDKNSNSESNQKEHQNVVAYNNANAREISSTNTANSINSKKEIKTPIVQELNKNNYTKKIFFIDTVTNNIIKEFNVKENNPFQNYDFEKKEYSDGLIIHYLNINQSVAYFNINNKNYNINVSSEKVFGAISTCDVRKRNKYVIVKYDLSLKNDGNEDIGKKSKAIILNEKGDMDFEIENNNITMSEFEITGNGKYLAFLFGGPDDVSLIPLTNKGISVYDLDLKIKLFEKTIEKALMGGSIVSFENAFVTIFDSPGGIYRIVKYDFEKMKIYSKEYGPSDDRLMEVRDNDVSFRNRFDVNSEIKIETFIKDFKKENLSW